MHVEQAIHWDTCLRYNHHVDIRSWTERSLRIQNNTGLFEPHLPMKGGQMQHNTREKLFLETEMLSNGQQDLHSTLIWLQHHPGTRATSHGCNTSTWFPPLFAGTGNTQWRKCIAATKPGYLKSPHSDSWVPWVGRVSLRSWTHTCMVRFVSKGTSSRKTIAPSCSTSPDDFFHTHASGNPEKHSHHVDTAFKTQQHN